MKSRRAETIESSSSSSIVTKIVSGGQTGVDRAALDVAIASGIEVGGWCPRDRRAENGRIPDRYPLMETESRSYAVRTSWNVRDSDGTLVIVLDEISRGTQLTIESARQHGKPLHVVHLLPPRKVGLLPVEKDDGDPVAAVVDWLNRHKIRTLNVAGPRGSSSRSMYPKAKAFLTNVLARTDAEPEEPAASNLRKRRARRS